MTSVSFQKLSLFAGSALALSITLAAHASMTKSGDASVVFAATGTAGMKFEGKTSDMEVREGKGDGVIRVTVPLNHLETGISLRDKHMKEKYLEIEKNPTSSFAFLRKDVQIPEAGKTTSGEVGGTFTLHGVTKGKRVKYTASRDGDTFKITANFDVDMKEHDVNVPNYLGVTVNKDVSVTAKFQLKE
ncbi:MAG: hypothetical protein NVS3B20_20510 [Polyangiales bacterium]